MSDDFSEVVDEIVDDLNPERVEREAARLNVSVNALLEGIVNETRARLVAEGTARFEES
jgi:hypothetical protein